MNPAPGLIAPPGPGEVIYPSGDGKPMAETGIHVLLMLTLIAMLRQHFRPRPFDVYVIGNIFLYYVKGDNSKRRSPDVMVVKGVDASWERDSFLIWEEKAVPCVAIELTSRETADEDTGPKKALYQSLGVREYFLFDPRSEYLPRQLMGYRLVKVAEGNGDNGEEVREQYDELRPAADGRLPSAELGMWLVPRGQTLDLVHQATGERLLPPPELAEQLAKYRLEADQATQRAENAEQRTEKAEQDLAALAAQAENERRAAENARRAAENARRAAENARRAAEDAHRALAEQTENSRRALAEQAEQFEKERRERERLEAELTRLRAVPPQPPSAPAADSGSGS